MKEPTTKEKAWMKKVERLLMNPPTDRIGFYTTGDRRLEAYDLTQEEEINNLQERRNMDFCLAVNELDCSLGSINSKVAIHSTCG